MKGLLRSAFLFLAVFLPILALAQAPTANFTASNTSGCAPVNVSFTNLSSTGPNITYYWDFGNGTTSTLQNTNSFYYFPGTYSVTLTVTNTTNNLSTTYTLANSITVIPSPAVNFVVSDSNVGCAPKTVAFTDLSAINAPGVSTYYWDFGDGSSSTSQNPSHTYATEGNFNVTLFVTNSYGCNNTLTKSQYVKTSRPAATFMASTTNSCTAPLNTIFANTTPTNNAYNPVTYQWLFGDGGSSTSTNPAYSYVNAGSFNVQLIATNAYGCKDTMIKTAYISVDSLDAKFNMSATTACPGDSVVFTNTSIPQAANTYWSFGDGGTSTLANPKHAYLAGGTYNVKLLINLHGCSDSIVHQITVLPKPTVNFSAPTLFSCSIPFNVNFTSVSSASSYSWDFGDGGTSTAANPTHSYGAQGLYTVKLIVTSASGCKDSMVKTNYIELTPVSYSLLGNGGGCAPATFTIGVVPYTSSIDTIAWNYGDGSPIGHTAIASHTYTATGIYTASFTFTTAAGCSASGSAVFTVSTKPTANFSATPPLLICPNTSVAFNNTSSASATSFSWNFGDGGTSTAVNPTHIYTVPGTYSVTLYAYSASCPDTFTQVNYITVKLPKADFIATYNCSTHSVSFVNNSVGATTQTWDFGDGSPAYTGVTPPPHTYAYSATPYTITLDIFDAATGCSNQATYTFSAINLVVAFTADRTNICKGETVNFTAGSGTGYIYDWNLGDGTILTNSTANIAHTYTTGGNYTITLTVRDVNGCSQVLTQNNYIHVGAVVANFTAPGLSGCKPFQVTFTDLSSSAANVATRNWDFGDATSIVVAGGGQLNHVYMSGGTYTVRLIVTDVLGCVDTVKKLSYISVAQPYASFVASDTNVCGSVPITFTNLSTSTNTPSCVWSFGDGTPNVATSVPTNQTHSYTTTGDYVTRLIVTDNVSGCIDTAVRTIHSRVTHAIFTTSSSTASCPPFSVVFTNSSTGNILSNWTFGNGNSAVQNGNLPNVSTLYVSSGTFPVKLVVTNSFGCKDSTTQNIVVTPGPTGTLSYNPQNGCGPLTVTFSATDANTTSLIWDMNNGFTASQANPPGTATYTYTYNQAGSYIPKLILYGGTGCTTALIGQDTIKVSKIKAGFSLSPNPVCTNTSVQFTDTSSSINGAITGREWNFGDGSPVVTTTNPSHSYAASGTYTIRLIASMAIGCPDTTTRTIVVNARPNVGAGNTQLLCIGDTVQLQATGAASYVWSPATGLSNANIANPKAYPAGTTTYTVTGTGANGCTNTAQVLVNVNPKPVIGVSPSQFICPGNNATLMATGGSTYTWTPATGLSATTGATVTASPAATTTYKVIGLSTNGCSDSASVTISVNSKPIVTVSGNNSICFGASTTLTANGASSYSWSPATGLSFTNSAAPSANPTVTTTYSVIGTSGVGCSDTALFTVTVKPLPTVNAGSSQVLCAGDSVQMLASGAQTYVWSPATGLSSATIANPKASPGSTTGYTVTGTGTNGCTNTAQVIITVNPKPVISAGTNVFICPGNTTVLTATGGSSYVWTPATGLSATTGATVTASPSVTTNYKVTGTSTNGCTDTAHVIVTVNSKPVITISGNTSMCFGVGTTLTASGASSYSWSPSTGLGSPNAATTGANPASTTTYVVTGTSGIGCSDTASVVVTVKPLPTVSAGSAQLLCIGDSVQLQASGAITYQWTPSAGLSSTTIANPKAAPGTTTGYTVTGTAANGCSNTSVVIVTVNPKPVISAGANVFICPGNTTVLTATGGTSYVWTPATGLSATTGATVNASPSTTTNYKVTGTSTNGCSDTAHVIVTVNNKPVITISGNTSMCFGVGTTLTASGASSYSWSPATGLGTPNSATTSANPASTTTYVVTGTSGIGCSDTASVVVTVKPLPTVSAGNAQLLCIGDSVQLQASGAITYQWTPPAGLSSTTIANPKAAPGTTTGYTVTGTAANGCSNTSVVIVTVNPKPVISAGANVFICPGNTTTLTATGGASYVWTPATGLSATTGASVNASPAVTTNYKVTGTSVNGCSDTAHVIVTVNSKPVISITGNTSMCFGVGTTLTASGASTYSWSPTTGLGAPNSATTSANPASTTTYVVTGTSGIGCSDTASVVVTVKPLPTVSAGNGQLLCIGDSVQLQATGALTYIWSPTAGLSNATIANPKAAPGATTTYTVTGTATNGCSNTSQVLVTVNPKPVISAGANVFICPGNSTTLIATGGASYVWTPATGLSATTGATVTASPAVTTNYKVTGTSSSGCSDTAHVIVTVNSKPIVTITGNNSMCFGVGTTLTASGASSYSWSPATGLGAPNSGTTSANPATTTTYIVTGTSGVGCSDTASITVTVKPLPVVNAGSNQLLCIGDSVQLQASGASTYVWTPATGLNSATIANPKAAPGATTTYTVTGTATNGCSNTSQVIVTVNPKPVVSAGPNQFICPGGSTTLTATGAASYVWSPATGLSATTGASVTASPAATITYLVTGTSTNGCSDTSHITVTVNAQPVVTVTGNLSICNGTSTALTASGAVSYSWSPATGLSATNTAIVTANPSATTTYTVIGTSGVGCTATTQVTLVVRPLPVVGAGADQSICKGDTAQLQATGAASYVWSPATGLSSTTIANPKAFISNTVTYTVIGTGTNGCTNTSSTTVTVNPKPTISAGPNQFICPGGTAVLTATGGASYSWSPSTGLSATTGNSVNASPSVTTTYTVTGTSTFGCSDTSHITVTVNAQPVIAVNGVLSICNGASTLLTASGAVTYSWSPATGLSSTNTAVVTANPTATTTYTVTGTSGVGCSASTQVTLTIKPLPAVSAGANQTICNGDTAQLQASGAATYVWSPAAGLTSTTIANPKAGISSTATYAVVGTGANGCTNTSSTTITVNQRPIISAGPNQFICPGGSTVLTATGGVSYSWSPATGLSATTGASVTASPAATTAYIVTGTAANGCHDTAHISVTVNPQPTVAITGNTISCLGTGTVLTASGAQTYSWSPAATVANPTSATTLVNPLVTTTYTVTGTSGVGCIGTAQVTVVIHSIPSVTASSANKAICLGLSTTLTAAGASTYSWSPAAGLSTTTGVTTTATPTATTTYIVTGTDAFGCMDTGIVTVNINPLPVIVATSSVPGSCKNLPITLHATGASTYSWSPATALSTTTGPTTIATPSVTTTYTVTGIDTNGCVGNTTVIATVFQPPVVSAGPDTYVCIGDGVTLTASGASTYVWSPAATLSTPTNVTTVASPTVNTTYMVKGTDAHGCVDSAYVLVSIKQLPIVSAGNDTFACKNVPVRLHASGAVTYTWSPTAGLSSATISNPLATPGLTTTYTVTGTDSFGCKNTDQMVDSIIPLPVISAGLPQSICKGNRVKLNATGGITYVWTPPAGLDSPSIASPYASPVVATNYTVTGTDINGCHDTSSVLVSLYPQPVINAGPDQTICIGQSALLQASGAVSYSWKPAGTLSCNLCDGPTATPIVSTNYIVAGTDANGCTDSDAVFVAVIPHVLTSVDSGGDMCEGGSFQLVARGGEAYTWTPAGTLNNSTISNPVASPSATTTYHVVIKENQCFSDDYDVTVVVHPKPTVNAGPDKRVPAGTPTQLNAVGTDISTYLWIPTTELSCSDCANPIASPLETTTYIVTVTSPFGCKASDDVKITVYCDGSQIWLPNTFTPNADGENDFFYPHAKGITTITRFRIYDRWGELIYDVQDFPVNDMSYGWDGTYKNRQLRPDVYIYIINAFCNNGDPVEKKGDITMLR